MAPASGPKPSSSAHARPAAPRTNPPRSTAPGLAEEAAAARRAAAAAAAPAAAAGGWSGADPGADAHGSMSTLEAQPSILVDGLRNMDPLEALGLPQPPFDVGAIGGAAALTHEGHGDLEAAVDAAFSASSPGGPPRDEDGTRTPEPAGNPADPMEPRTPQDSVKRLAPGKQARPRPAPGAAPRPTPRRAARAADRWLAPRTAAQDADAATVCEQNAVQDRPAAHAKKPVLA